MAEDDVAGGPVARIAEAWIAALGLLLVEGLAVGIAAQDELTGLAELGWALRTLVPLGAVLALAVAPFAASVRWGFEHAERRVPRIALCLITLAWSGVVAVGVSGGRSFTLGSRMAFVVVVTLAASAMVWLAAPPLSRGLARIAKRSRWFSALPIVALLVGIELANARVLPRLYPVFHDGLSVLGLLIVPLGLWPPGHRRRALPAGGWLERARFGAAVGTALLTVILALLAPRSLRSADNIRWTFRERAPRLSYAVRVASALEPPPALDDAIPEAATATERVLDWTGRDILLVSIDALRADHVGAYGYGRAMTPRLDKLAEGGVVFEAAYTATPHTSYAVASLMTGKFMRPLLMQGLGADSETLAQALRRYDYRTAAFYPPAIFFVDRERFTAFEANGLGFEYEKRQFSSASERARELVEYLKTEPPNVPIFAWAHLFEPHEPYLAYPESDLGERDIDRYDAEIRAADAGLGELVDAMRASRPRAIVIVTADHGEEFGDHGGRYHGTTVYEEQVRVPLVIHAPGLVEPRRVVEPVSLVDLVPTIERALAIPVSPRIRGRDLGALMLGRDKGGGGFAFSETDDHTMLAQATLRLICARKIGACRLFELASDPAQRSDVAESYAEAAGKMKAEQRGFAASMGRFERSLEPWPEGLRRALAGDVDAAPDAAALLDDADLRFRRKAAEALFELAVVAASDPRESAAHPDITERVRRLVDDVAPQLERALATDDDDAVRSWAALALTRLGRGAPRTFDLASGEEESWRRLASLVLAEAGDDRGAATLLAWWSAAFPEEGPASVPIPHERAKQLVSALGRVGTRGVVIALSRGLIDVRLRVALANAFERIGDAAARPLLAKAFAVEPYHDARFAMARAVVALGGGVEIAEAMARYLGAPDPIAGGLELGARAKILAWIGGPNSVEQERLRRFAQSGVMVGATIPKGGNGRGFRVILRAHASLGGQAHFSVRARGRSVEDRTRTVPKAAPELDPKTTLRFDVPGGDRSVELHGELRSSVSGSLRAGDASDFVIYATDGVVVEAFAVVPLTDDVAASVTKLDGAAGAP
ncbi:MAG: hypothetical protein EXR75_03095 [Myxococcales bacterium]|nr:hypothetical protein [Myxococcales bacterium]